VTEGLYLETINVVKTSFRMLQTGGAMCCKVLTAELTPSHGHSSLQSTQETILSAQLRVTMQASSKHLNNGVSFSVSRLNARENMEFRVELNLRLQRSITIRSSHTQLRVPTAAGQ
jgi:hypothetical protein